MSKKEVSEEKDSDSVLDVIADYVNHLLNLYLLTVFLCGLCVLITLFTVIVVVWGGGTWLDTFWGVLGVFCCFMIFLFLVMEKKDCEKKLDRFKCFVRRIRK